MGLMFLRMIKFGSGIAYGETRRVSGIDHFEAGEAVRVLQARRDGWSHGDPSGGEVGCPSAFARRQPVLVKTIT